MMIFNKTKIEGVYLIQADINIDNRGSFTRFWCNRESQKLDLCTSFVQMNLSKNPLKGTFRGLHYQDKPYEEVKVVNCIKGSIFDIVLDLRKDSKSYKTWEGFVLSETNMNSLYIPKGCAHGFMTLENESNVLYQMSEYYYPECSKGIRWDDACFNIVLPLNINLISEKDRTFDDFSEILSD